jgi:hypothetical protein
MNEEQATQVEVHTFTPQDAAEQVYVDAPGVVPVEGPPGEHIPVPEEFRRMLTDGGTPVRSIFERRYDTHILEQYPDRNGDVFAEALREQIRTIRAHQEVRLTEAGGGAGVVLGRPRRWMPTHTEMTNATIATTEEDYGGPIRDEVVEQATPQEANTPDAAPTLYEMTPDTGWVEANDTTTTEDPVEEAPQEVTPENPPKNIIKMMSFSYYGTAVVMKWDVGADRVEISISGGVRDNILALARHADRVPCEREEARNEDNVVTSCLVSSDYGSEMWHHFFDRNSVFQDFRTSEMILEEENEEVYL